MAPIEVVKAVLAESTNMDHVRPLVMKWRREIQGTVSTGVYDVVWEKRGGEWRCLERTSTIDQNWPAQTFQPYVDQQDQLFRAS